MRLSFFAAALLGLTAVNAINIESSNVVKVNIPECQGKPDPDSLIMEAVAELGDKSKDMA